MLPGNPKGVFPIPSCNGMKPERWNLVQELLLEALELDPASRPEFVDRVSERDPALKNELVSLLRSHEATGFMDGDVQAPEEEGAELLGRLRRALAGRYSVSDVAGRGGMATVFRAHDARHARSVAIKVLHPRLVGSIGARHFLREIGISARLRHPHILPLFDSGEADGLLFFVMPFIDGETVRQRIERLRLLEVDDALRIGREVAGALGYAHRQGVIHRDVKPGNILLDEGHAVVADFGVGRALRGTDDARLTRTGVVIGTPRYMSPQQALGDQVDETSDLYGLGCVLFEMLAGRAPFEGDSAAWIIRQHLVEEPPLLTEHRPDAPAWLVDAVHRTIAKEPADRFQSAEELLAALGGETGRSAVGGRARSELAPHSGDMFTRPAVAVLPFENRSRDEDHEYFADGLTEDLITALSNSRLFPVIARNSTFAYKGKNVRVQDVARDLGARYVVEGSVRRGQGRVRITAQLIDGQSGQSVWANRYDRDLTDIFDIQDELSETIFVAVEPEMGKAERSRVLARSPGNLNAWESCQLGMWHFHRYTGEDFESAREHFERALSLDATLVAALWGIAETHYYDLVLGLAADPVSSRERVLEVAQRAVDLDERDAQARCALGRARVCRREHDAAIPEFEAALELNPSLARAHYGLGAALVFRGSAPAAIAHLENAIRLSPRDLYMGSFLVRMADAHLFMRDYVAAEEWARNALRQSGFQWSRYATLISALAHMGRLEEAGQTLREVTEKRRDFSVDFVRRTHLFTHAPDMDHFLDGLRAGGAPE